MHEFVPENQTHIQEVLDVNLDRVSHFIDQLDRWDPNSTNPLDAPHTPLTSEVSGDGLRFSLDPTEQRTMLNSLYGELGAESPTRIRHRDLKGYFEVYEIAPDSPGDKPFFIREEYRQPKRGEAIEFRGAALTALKPVGKESKPRSEHDPMPTPAGVDGRAAHAAALALMKRVNKEPVKPAPKPQSITPQRAGYSR